MKYINKLFAIVLVLGITTACENTELDLLENPNAVAPENASLNDLYNAIQLGFRDVFNSAQYEPGAVARMYHAAGASYEAFVPAEQFDDLWVDVYSGNLNTNLGDPGLFPDIDALIEIAEQNNLDIHIGSAKILKAYVLVLLADLFGSAPSTQALQGTDVISPTVDSGDQLYAAANTLLDEAITQLTGTTAAAPAFDNFYGGDPAKWVKAANTLKLKMAVNTKDAATINSIISGGNFITDAADDFQFTYGSQRTNPNSRHPLYNNHYEVGDGDYLSNYYMWLLVGDKVNADGVAILDPRRRYYFYQKIEESENQDPTTYSCQASTLPDQSAKPAHWETTSPNIPYCVIPGTGYSGRDHLNSAGIPPDGPTRTSYGLYPMGGQFDDDTFTDTRQSGSSGGLGRGIWPVMISPVIDLLRAEAALTLNTGEDARMLIESGIRASMAKAVSFRKLSSCRNVKRGRNKRWWYRYG